MTFRNAIKRFVTLQRRRQRASQLGFQFNRAAGFVLPFEIRIGTTPINLSLPDDTGTKTAFIDVLLDDCYLLNEFPDDIKTVIDVGGHVGLFSIAARERWPNAIIHTYEPNGALKERWEKHASQANFFVYEEAVGGIAGTVNLITNDDSVQARVRETIDGSIRQIAFCTAISRLGDQVDLVKLDCEGAEWAILRDEETWKRVRFLTMEFHLWSGYSLEDLKLRISELGFHIKCLKMTGADFGLLSAYR